MKRQNIQSGQTLVLLVVMIGAMISVLALVVDYGLGVNSRSRLQATADSAALAGAAVLPEAGDAAAIAVEYAVKGGVPAEDVATELLAPSVIKVSVERTSDSFFARFFNVLQMNTGATATAEKGAPDAMSNSVPIVIDVSNYLPDTDLQFQTDQNAGLNICRGVPCPVLYDVILGRPGIDYFREVFDTGYPGELNVGEVMQQNGNNGKWVGLGVEERIASAPGETWDNFAPNSRRLVYVPIVTIVPENGQGTFKIVGFGAFFFISVEMAGTTEGIVTGRFVRYMTNGGVGRMTHPWRSGDIVSQLPNPVDFRIRVVQLID